MGNTSSHHSVSSPTPTSTSQPSSSNSSTKSPKSFPIHANPFSHFNTHNYNRRASSIEEHGSLLKNADHNVEEDDDDGTYLLRRGSVESREEWLARKQIMASRIKGDEVGDVGAKMWKDYSIVDGKGRL